MKKEKIFEYAGVILFAVASAVFEKFVCDRHYAEDKEDLKNEILAELKTEE